ncbi:winged helix-turn-helix domain-containing protein [Nonomuraea sp. NPDC049480]|uniref:winged helix-turn-helix domain-containing protein n=1 Tax=Nonomuraea sp. NPDC049480 TaxID=3364353 RepID=UPI0037B1B5B9
MAEDIEAEIASGQVAAGAKMPTELGLASQYGVSRVTVRRAIKDLAEQGLHGRSHAWLTTGCLRPGPHRLLGRARPVPRGVLGVRKRQVRPADQRGRPDVLRPAQPGTTGPGTPFRRAAPGGAPSVDPARGADRLHLRTDRVAAAVHRRTRLAPVCR